MVTEPHAARSLEQMMAGNRHFVIGARISPHLSLGRRQEVVSGQHPLAAVLCCSDSRVPPEIIFDQGLGDLFVVRVAGNILDGAVLASLEYAAEHLAVPLLMVLGHSHCGAVQAAAAGGHVDGHIRYILEAIAPAVAQARQQPGDLVENAVRLNVEAVVQQLVAASPALRTRVDQGKLTIVGACYNLKSGVVELICGPD